MKKNLLSITLFLTACSAPESDTSMVEHNHLLQQYARAALENAYLSGLNRGLDICNGKFPRHADAAFNADSTYLFDMAAKITCPQP